MSRDIDPATLEKAAGVIYRALPYRTLPQCEDLARGVLAAVLPDVRRAVAVDREALVEKAHALIAAERKRQIDVEGWSAEHDREHGPAALYHAATAYEVGDPGWWPWHRQWWKPKDALSNLIRAGALYQAAAEVARTGTYHDPSFYGQCRERVAETIAALLSAVLAVVPEVQQAPAVDRDALVGISASLLRLSYLDETEGEVIGRNLRLASRQLKEIADSVQDAADVRREVAEEIAADLEFKGKATDRYGDHDYYRAARIAREAGGRDE